jgi:hypothetical protein
LRTSASVIDAADTVIGHSSTKVRVSRTSVIDTARTASFTRCGNRFNNNL